MHLHHPLVLLAPVPRPGPAPVSGRQGEQDACEMDTTRRELPSADLTRVCTPHVSLEPGGLYCIATRRDQAPPGHSRRRGHGTAVDAAEPAAPANGCDGSFAAPYLRGPNGTLATVERTK